MYEGWIVLLIIGMVGSIPLNEERIYFPGESPESEPRSYGLQPNIPPSQEHQPYIGGDLSEESAWVQNNHHPQASVPEGVYPKRPDLSGYKEQNAYGVGYSGEPERAVNWAANSQQGNIENPHQASSYGASSFHHSTGSQGASVPINPSQGVSYSSISNNGIHHVVHHGDQKMIKHTWTSQHSTSGSGELQHSPQYTSHPETDNHGQEKSGLQTGFSSISHQAHSTKDLASIIGGLTHQRHELHPTIQQAMGNAYGQSPEKTVSQPSQHSVHKISHVKKTSIQNIGKEPVHIQSTSSNDDISLSHLIEELKMLENSPKHVNITWCEEKIKEFLQSLRRKQASGVFINQQVQEETLHQVLTHEGVQNVDNVRGVHEPFVTKVTVRPLGREDMAQSNIKSETFTNHQGGYTDISNVKAPQPPTNQNQEESQSKTDTEVVTIIPVSTHQQPEIMAHEQELSNQSPPLTSDNIKDLQELDLDLPEYIPFENVPSEDIQAAESNIRQETRPFPKPAEGETSQAQILSTETQQQQETNISIINHHHNNSEATHYGAKIISEQENEESMDDKVSSNHHGQSNDHGRKVNYDFIQNKTTQHHNIQGRPQAPQGEYEGASETIQEENIGHPEESSGSLDSSATKDIGGNGFIITSSDGGHYTQSHQSTVNIQTLHKQQVNYDTLIEELIQLESIPGHQAIDKCEEKIQEFLEILKYQQEQGFGRNQQELQRLHQTLIEQAQERSKQLENPEDTTLPPTSFWRRVQKKIKTTYESAKDRAKDVIG